MRKIYCFICAVFIVSNGYLVQAGNQSPPDVKTAGTQVQPKADAGAQTEKSIFSSREECVDVMDKGARAAFNMVGNSTDINNAAKSRVIANQKCDEIQTTSGFQNDNSTTVANDKAEK